MRKYARMFRYAARDQLAYLPAFLARNVFFIVVVFIFWSLWRVVFAGKGAIAGFSLVQTLWYLTFTETIELSKARVLYQLSGEVKDGTIAVALSRPYSYPISFFARSMGESLVKILPILLEGFVLATLLVGPLPGYSKALPFGLILIVAGLAVTNLWLLAIGLLAFWTEEVSPFYWIVQKLVFILGGLFMPIDLFPGWLAAFARFLPFAFSAYWPAYTMVNFSVEAFLTALMGATAYIACLGCLVGLLYTMGRRRVHAQGG